MRKSEEEGIEEKEGRKLAENDEGNVKEKNNQDILIPKSIIVTFGQWPLTEGAFPQLGHWTGHENSRSNCWVIGYWLLVSG